MPSWAYMLRCADGSFYTGCTTDLERRIGAHQGGEIPGYTAARRPVELVWAEAFQHIDDVIAAERRIKGWSRAKKLAQRYWFWYGGAPPPAAGAEQDWSATSMACGQGSLSRLWPCL